MKEWLTKVLAMQAGRPELWISNTCIKTCRKGMVGQTWNPSVGMRRQLLDVHWWVLRFSDTLSPKSFRCQAIEEATCRQPLPAHMYITHMCINKKFKCNYPKTETTAPIRHHMLPNKNSSTKNGLPLFELLANVVPQSPPSPKHRLLPLLLVTPQKVRVRLYH